jgi:steroid delta-isomerase-like uncharacterized protein
MSEGNIAVFDRLTVVWNEGTMAALDEILATDFRFHDPHNPEVRTRDEYTEYISRVRTAFPDVHATVEDTVAAVDKLAFCLTFRGTHTGAPPGGLAPTGKRVDMSVFGILHFAGDKIEEYWSLWDALTYFRQLGVIPPAE